MARFEGLPVGRRYAVVIAAATLCVAAVGCKRADEAEKQKPPGQTADIVARLTHVTGDVRIVRRGQGAGAAPGPAQLGDALGAGDRLVLADKGQATLLYVGRGARGRYQVFRQPGTYVARMPEKDSPGATELASNVAAILESNNAVDHLEGSLAGTRLERDTVVLFFPALLASSNRPAFAWAAPEGVTQARLRLAAGAQILFEGSFPTPPPVVAFPKDLPDLVPGKPYTWTVEIRAGASRTVSQTQVFYVADEQTMENVRAAHDSLRALMPGGLDVGTYHFVMARLCEKKGLLVEAARHLMHFSNTGAAGKDLSNDLKRLFDRLGLRAEDEALFGKMTVSLGQAGGND